MKKALKIYISVDMEGMAGITSPSVSYTHLWSDDRYNQTVSEV